MHELNVVTSSSSLQTAKERNWWKRAVIYEIAVPSFLDSNGDGRGDLAGLSRKVDYLKSLGIDAVWLTPIYASPMKDFGYDIADFCTIDPSFGSMADFLQLLHALHDERIRLILDFVPNHTSDRHPWFADSRKSRTGEKADWYLWADAAANGGPPNNWLSRFGGSAWSWDETREQFYYHSFLASQPDLNWRNTDVRSAMCDVMRFWLDRGVDGLRVDASAVLIKDALLRDNPPNPKADANMPPPQRYTPVFTDDRPEDMTCIEDLRKVVDEYEGRFVCGEVQGKTDRIGHFYGSEVTPRFHLPLNFALLDSEWDALPLQATIDAYLNAIPADGWPDWVVGGHDKPRVASKIGQAQARILSMLLLTIRGTPILFAGDEIGAERVPIPKERVQDPFEKRLSGFGLGRDPERSPMRWDDSEHGGFTTGRPWLPLDGERTRSVDGQMKEPRSLWHLYRQLIALRKAERCLTDGEYWPSRARNDVLCYGRRWSGDHCLIGLNITGEPRRWDWRGRGTLLLSTHLDRKQEMVNGPVQLRADEGWIVKLESASK